MAARRRFRRSAARKKDMVWITTIIESSILEATPTDIGLLVTGSDWSAGNSGFDRCTLLSIRGWLSLAQQGAATAAEATGVFMALYLTDTQVPTNSMDPSSATEYNAFDVLFTDGAALTAAASTAQQALWGRQLLVKAKRKLTTATDVRLALSVSPDTGAPRANVVGVTRSLLLLDSQ